jgi:uncharacterized protein YdeI (YjbR/CyaY-like superfamily)
VNISSRRKNDVQWNGMRVKTELKTLKFDNRAEWREWLARSHDSSPSVQLAVVKKGSKKRGVTYEEAVQEAICFGWIDSRANILDENYFKVLMSPRKPGSNWSKSNKERAGKMIDEGLMTQAGLSKIEAAKKDGSWGILDEVEEMLIPEDLERALSCNPPAKENFEAFIPSYRKQAIYWVLSGKRPDTRAKRVEKIARAAAENEKIA